MACILDEAANTTQTNLRFLSMIMRKGAKWPADPPTTVDTTKLATASDPSAWSVVSTPHLTRV